MKENTVLILGRIASLLSIMMYTSYVFQIVDNVNGTRGNPVQPLVATVNCGFWLAYAYKKKNKDYPLIVANLPGVFLSFTAFLTALI